MKDNTDFPELQEKCATKVRQKYTSSPIEQDIHNKELSFPQQAHFGTENAIPQPACLGEILEPVGEKNRENLGVS